MNVKEKMNYSINMKLLYFSKRKNNEKIKLLKNKNRNEINLKANLLTLIKEWKERILDFVFLEFIGIPPSTSAKMK